MMDIKTAGNGLLALDDRTHRFFQAYTGTRAVRALDVVSKLGDQPALRIIAGSLIVAGTFAGSNRLVRAGARMMIAHEAATATKDLVKTNVDRTRPRSAQGRGEKKPRKGKHRAKEMTSFPSGHSAGVIAAARAFSREFPEHRAAALGAAGLIATSQVPRCAHYPTDVAAGLAVGLCAEAASDAAWNAARMTERSIGRS
jgi:undecaprenyl-diphosphatase